MTGRTLEVWCFGQVAGWLVERAPAQARRVREAFAADGWDAPVLGELLELVDQRAQLLIDATRPS